MVWDLVAWSPRAWKSVAWESATRGGQRMSWELGDLATRGGQQMVPDLASSGGASEAKVGRTSVGGSLGRRGCKGGTFDVGANDASRPVHGAESGDTRSRGTRVRGVAADDAWRPTDGIGERESCGMEWYYLAGTYPLPSLDRGGHGDDDKARWRSPEAERLALTPAAAMRYGRYRCSIGNEVDKEHDNFKVII
ncbi:hypothetical protein GUJ93_ZPchr0008g12894 [Zizania palustris]|uniref:Uncharacterized protein n=1 Tax=Zizania palustris TaxID=103762 RepID=A0A8J5RLB6_ZIZPA|nr:hypothetical protein GUJ93_ZPchr0008g12894 [Zizania palustris]